MAIPKGDTIKVDGVYRIRRGSRARVTRKTKDTVYFQTSKAKRGRFTIPVKTMSRKDFRSKATLLWCYE